MTAIARIIAFALSTGFASLAAADDQRARANYMIHCQGCHLPDAAGFAGKVPRIRDFLGFYLHSQDGREFVVRVPGVATSALSDDKLTELMNWLLLTFSARQLPPDFALFTVDEVAALRADPESDPGTTRKNILELLAADLPELAEDLKTQEY